MYGQYAEGATEDAARALAASRRFDPHRHDPAGRCDESTPCRLCYYDAAAAVAAVIIHIETHRAVDPTDEPTDEPTAQPTRRRSR